MARDNTKQLCAKRIARACSAGQSKRDMQPAAAHSVPGLHPVHECASSLQPASTYLEHLDQLPTACDTTLRSSLPTSAVEAAERSDTICEVVVRSCGLSSNLEFIGPWTRPLSARTCAKCACAMAYLRFAPVKNVNVSRLKPSCFVL